VDDLGESLQCLANIEVISLKAEVCVKKLLAIITRRNKVISINSKIRRCLRNLMLSWLQYQVLQFFYVTVVLQFLAPER